MQIQGAKKRYLTLVGNVKHPEKVVLDGQEPQEGAAKANGVLINGANEVTVQRLHRPSTTTATASSSPTPTGYHLNDLVARYVGVYGLYAFNSIGGEMRRDIGCVEQRLRLLRRPDAEADQADPHDRLRRRRPTATCSATRGTNSRYVTITKSKWFNNGVGIVPNALDSEKFPPPEENVITDNDIFWNNFDYYKGAPFKLRPPATGDVPYPTGVGVLLFGGRNNTITNNRIYGNWLLGAGMIEQFLLKNPDDGTLVGNQITDNQFGLNGTDLNGRDIGYDGNGSGNCVSGQHRRGLDHARRTAARSSPCPFAGAEHVQRGSPQHGRRLGDRARPVGQLHPPRPRGPAGQRIKPMEIYSADAYGVMMRRVPSAPRPRVRARPGCRRDGRDAGSRRSAIHDNYYDPLKLKVKAGTTVKWVWPNDVGDTHDVNLGKRPKGVKRVLVGARGGRLLVQADAEEAGQVLHLLLAARRDEDDDHRHELTTGRLY